MTTVSAGLAAASASIMLLLGLIHLVYTFSGQRLHPRSLQVAEQMQNNSPRLTSQTTIWSAWIGFNASHSLGAIMFGVVYLNLATTYPDILWGSITLRIGGLLALIAYLALAARYWFSTPFRAIAVATTCYGTALLIA